ncbi:hypothetical protein [Desertibaculum subflavum]|uniref:hypothetical protein n=1 Tax=Desertibaculum subflavum TaxID=2268458 RepID=UPI000E66BE4A
MFKSTDWKAAALGLAFACFLTQPACADSSPARASAAASGSAAASAVGITGAASYAVGTVVPGPVGTVLQEGGLAVMQDGRRIGQAATETLRAPLPVTDRTVTIGPPPAEALNAPVEAAR